MSLNAKNTDRTRGGQRLQTFRHSWSVFPIWFSLFCCFFLGRSLYLQLFIIILLICCLLTARTITTMPRRATIAPRKIKKGAHRKEGNSRWHPKNFCRPPKKLCQTIFKCFPNEKNLQKKDDGKGRSGADSWRQQRAEMILSWKYKYLCYPRNVQTGKGFKGKLAAVIIVE